MEIQFVYKKNRFILQILFSISIIFSGLLLAYLSFASLKNIIFLFVIYVICLIFIYIYSKWITHSYYIDHLSDVIEIDGKNYSLEYIDEIFFQKERYEIRIDDMLLFLPKTEVVYQFVKEREWKITTLDSSYWQLRIKTLLFVVIPLIYMFYQVFILFFGWILCFGLGYIVIRNDIMGLRLLQIFLIIILEILFWKSKNPKVYKVAYFLSVVLICYINSMTSIPNEYVDQHGYIACIKHGHDLYLYRDVKQEYGILKNVLHNVEDDKLYDFSGLWFLQYRTDNTQQYAIFYRYENTEEERNDKLAEYNHLVFQNESQNIYFLNGLSIDGKNIDLQDITLINDSFLEVKVDQKVQFYIYVPTNLYQKDQIKILNVIDMSDSCLLKSEYVYDENENSQNEDIQEDTYDIYDIQTEEVTQEEKDRHGEEIVSQLNKAAKNIKTFQSTQEIVKIEATSQDYNVILKEIAKTFTIIHNDDELKIDTQILQIDVTSGDIQEFGAHIFDRQDISGQEKKLNHYYYRVKRVDNYYLAVRVKEDTNVDIGLKKLQEPISTNTSNTTDYLYCIEGKKEVNGW